MSLGSNGDAYSIGHDRDYEEEINVGDLVRTGPNLFPHFEVTAIFNDKACVRNTTTGETKQVLIRRCRKINGKPGFDQAAD